MFNINGFELLLIVTLFVLLFGPDRLPEVMAQAGRVLRDVRRLTDEATADLRRELDLASRSSSQWRAAPGATSPAPQDPAPTVASGASDAVAPTVSHPTDRRDSPEDRQPAPSGSPGRSAQAPSGAVPKRGTSSLVASPARVLKSCGDVRCAGNSAGQATTH